MNEFLRRKLRFLAIPHIVKILALFQLTAFILEALNPQTATQPGFLSLIEMDAQKVLRGELWRVLTFLFVPLTTHPLWLLITIWVMWTVGDGLELAMGGLSMTLYVLVAAFTQIFAAFTLGWQASSEFVFYCLLLAYATLYSDKTVYLFFVLPLQMKWIGYMISFYIFTITLLAPVGTKIGIVVSILAYVIFFGLPFLGRFLRTVFFQVVTPTTRIKDSDAQAFHRCCVCGANDISHPDMIFRVFSDGKEYCTLHLPKNNSSV